MMAYVTTNTQKFITYLALILYPFEYANLLTSLITVAAFNGISIQERIDFFWLREL